VVASQARIGAAQDAMTAALDSYLTRLNGVVVSRVKGPRARKGTRWWGESAKSLYLPMPGGTALETKALDAAYALPGKLVAEAADAARPVALRVAYDAAAHTASQLGVSVPAGNGGLFAVDHDALNAAIETAVGRILDVAQHHAVVVRQAITAADSSAETLDEVLDQIEAAHAKGGNWLRMSGRALTNALIQDAALSQARALGATHAQWLSRRDDHVRPTHAAADGQERPIGDKFQVGKFALLHPCDPADLPESWEEIAGCRCALRIRPPSDEHRAALRVLAATQPGQPGPGAATLLADVAAGARELPPVAGTKPDRPVATGAAPGASAPSAPGVVTTGGRDAVAPLAAGPGTRPAGGSTVREVPTPAGVPSVNGVAPVAYQLTTTAPVVAYRGLASAVNAVAGQQIVSSAAAVLGLTAPAIIAEGAPVLAVLIPAGVLLTVAAGMVILPQGQPLEVLASGPAGVQAQPAQLDSSS